MTYLLLVPPVIYALWAFFGAGVKTETRAQKTPWQFYYPRLSVNGNNPDSQYAHEAGGYRFGAILSTLAMLAVAVAAQFFPSHILTLVFGLLAQLVALVFTFNFTRAWIDIAEHGAEIMHAEGIEGYREAEIARMLGGAEYGDLTAEQVQERLDKAAWRSGIIFKLGYRR